MMDGRSIKTETGETIYCHEDIPDTDFWLPVQLRDPIKAHVPPVYCRLLTCKTRLAFVHAGEYFKDSGSSRCSAIDLIDQQGKWIGVLRLSTSDITKDCYGLIELSAGSVEKRDTERMCFDEWDRPCFQHCWANNKYEFCNVMAISWSNGVAYREAVGRVKKDCWQKLKKDEVDMVLG
jgi:hypothetical protein